jgi:hypothetical protein
LPGLVSGRWALTRAPRADCHPSDRALRGILERHNALEEGPDGIYAACERLAGDDAATLLASLRAYPEVSVNPHVDSDLVEGATRRALARAGYAFEDFEV